METMRIRTLFVTMLFVVASSMACATAVDQPQPAPPSPPPMEEESALTPADAREFLDESQERLAELFEKSARAAWVQSNFITHDTQILAADASGKVIAEVVRLAKEATKFDDLDLPYDDRRQLEMLKNALTMPAPSDPQKTKELTTIASELEALYGKGEYCREDGDCLDLEALMKIMAESRDPAELADVWGGWRTISPPMKPLYERFVELSNEGARELGFDDTGSMWRSKYDMPPDEFAEEVDRLWGQVEPLYESLHCYVRAKLNETYGEDVQPATGPIRADLLGNMWAQEWGNIFPVVAPGDADPGYDLTSLLEENEIDEIEMVRIGERFFTSLGFEPLPDTFWERSLFVKPRDRDVVCHASAWDVDNKDDLRIKMCIDINAEDFQTIHHELGHNFYQRAYSDLPLLYKESANDGFHEAVGDAIALSVTPSYLMKIGLLEEEPESDEIALLLRDALDKIAFLPFGLLVDQWRWKVFSGEITPEEYNEGWWNLRTKYQGIEPPVERAEGAFDPGAKYHIPGNTPYTRYFLARILQFQFHRALCETAGYEGPLNQCTIYGNEEAGARLKAMLELGASRPWPEALEAITGSPDMDATAIVDYFEPLLAWLEEQNEGRQCGW
ncbi:MAG: M2 family metallopeptidase [Thermoanaerobaculia bacterium]|nr:M2 family metallopeptidase [Thermoanaerobaculia bacterium]